jgi:hypothetical protein
MSIIIMAASLVERVLLIRILNVVISAVEVATSPEEPNAFLFLLVWFVIADYFAVSDIYVLWDVFQRGEETCVGSWDVWNVLEQASAFVAKTLGPKWLETGILAWCRCDQWLFSRAIAIWAVSIPQKSS